jgi:hypothetical protein
LDAGRSRQSEKASHKHGGFDVRRPGQPPRDLPGDFAKLRCASKEESTQLLPSCLQGCGRETAQVSKFGDWLGKDNLICVSLEIAQDRCAKDGRNDNRAEEAELEIIKLSRVSFGSRKFKSKGQDYAIASIA